MAHKYEGSGGVGAECKKVNIWYSFTNSLPLKRNVSLN